MSIELQALFGAAVIMLALVLVQGALIPATYGFKWGLGPRDEPREPTALLGRMKRIVANHVEAMAVFVPLILIAYFAEISTPLTQWGAILFVAARAAFAVIYAMGIPVLRSAAWGAGLIGLLMIGFELLRSGF